MYDELTNDEQQDIIKNNQYLTRDKFDVSTILVDGVIPQFSDSMDRVMCLIDVSTFVRKNGFGNHINLAKFLDTLEVNEFMLFIRKLSLQQVEIICSRPEYVVQCPNF